MENTIPKELLIDAEWTNDCQGKKDYDGNIVSISTRYWPARDYTGIGGKITLPSANSSIVISAKNSVDYIHLIEKEFEFQTEDEVKAAVEVWAQDQMNKIINALKGLYDKSE